MALVAGTALAFLVMTIVAAGFAAAATWLAHRFGAWTLLPVWLAVSVLAAGAHTLRLRQIQGGGVGPDSLTAPFPIFWHFLSLWLLGLGAVSLLLMRRRRRRTLTFDRGVAVRSVGAFLAGALVWIFA